MKKIRIFILLSLIICCLTMCMGCASSLVAPTNLKIDQDTLVLTWASVDGAKSYTLDVNGEELDSSKNSYKLEKLDEGEYVIKVKACGSGRSVSKWSESIPFTREKETGMIFKRIANGTEYEVSNVGTAEGDIVVPDTYRNRPVTSIGRKAFAKKPRVTSVVLGDNITQIGEQAFAQCAGLKSVNIPKNVVSIGKKAFQSCSALESDIVIPQGVTVIEESTFGYCRSIKSVTISSNVTAIGESAFADCDLLEQIIIPDSVEVIGDYAFSTCFSATELYIGKGVVSIGQNAFQQCSALTEVYVGDSVEVIGNAAFKGSENITTVTMSDATVSIGSEVFKGCAKLATVELSENISYIGADAFLNTDIWTKASNLVYVQNWLVDSKVKNAGAYTIADNTIGIAVYAMSYCTEVSQIIIPNSVKIINDLAFFGMSKMSSVVLGEGVEEIGTQAFSYCQKLTDVKLGGWDFAKREMTDSSVKSIGKYAFYNCPLLTAIDIPETVEFIGAWAFRKTGIYENAGKDKGVVYAGNWVVDWNDKSIALAGGEINIKDGTAGIAEYAFYKCYYVSNVEMPDSVQYINRSAFYQTSYILSVTLPAELKRIEEFTFYGCFQLLSVGYMKASETGGDPVRVEGFPETLELIGRSSFYECSLLGCDVDETGYGLLDRDFTLVIPDSVKTIERYAFYNCGAQDVNPDTGIKTLYGIDKVVLGSGLEFIGENAFGSFQSLKALDTGDGLKTIDWKSFYKCPNLEEIRFGASVEKVDERAFYGCSSLKSVEFSSSVKEIADYAFYNCEALENIRFNEGLKKIGNYAFAKALRVESLYIPDSVESIGKHAFRGMTNLKSVVLTDGVASIANYAFYGCAKVSFYVEKANANGWENRWNASYRPVVYGAVLSSEGYVVSFTKTATSFQNVNEKSILGGPIRDGYTFVGWATTQNATTAEFFGNEVLNAADGTTLYAVWSVKTAD